MHTLSKVKVLQKVSIFSVSLYPIDLHLRKSRALVFLFPLIHSCHSICRALKPSEKPWKNVEKKTCFVLFSLFIFKIMPITMGHSKNWSQNDGTQSTGDFKDGKA